MKCLANIFAKFSPSENNHVNSSRSMTFHQITVGRQTPDIGRHSAEPCCVQIYMCYIVYNACFYTNYEIYHPFILFWTSFHLTSCTSNILFLCWISNWTLRMTFRNKHSSTTSKRLQPNSGHSLKNDDCNLILNILIYMWIELSVWSFDIKVSTSSTGIGV